MNFIILFIMAIVLTTGTTIAREAENSANEHGHDAASMQMPAVPDEPWQTDAPLRKGMEGIRRLAIP